MKMKITVGFVLAVALLVLAQGTTAASGRSHDEQTEKFEAMLERAESLEGVDSIKLLKEILGLNLPAQLRTEAQDLFNDALATHANAGPLEFGQAAAASSPVILVDPGDDACDLGFPITLDHSENMHINPAGDHDWREFTLDTRTRVLIETRSPEPFADDTDLVLWGDCDGGVAGDQVGFNDDSGGTFLSSMELCLRPGTYYLEVGGWQDITVAQDFELVVEAGESPCVEIDDPSNSTLLITPESDHSIPDPVETLHQEGVYGVPFGIDIFEHAIGFVPFNTSVDAIHELDLRDSVGDIGTIDEVIIICEICLCPIEGPCDCPEPDPDCLPEMPPLLFSVNPSVFVVNDGVLKHLFEGEVYSLDDDGVITPDPGWASLNIPNVTLDALAMDWDGRYYFSTDKIERIVYNGRRKTLFPGNVYYRVPNGGGKIRRYFNGGRLGIGNVDAFHLFHSGDIAFSTADVEHYAGPDGVETLFPEHIYACDPQDCVPQIYFDAGEWGNENLNGFSVGGFNPFPFLIPGSL